MWAKYDQRSATLEAIASFIGWYGSDPWPIAQGVGFFTNETGIAEFFGLGDRQQDLALATQVSSAEDNVPSISIVNF